MSSASGIGISPALSEAFAAACEAGALPTVRFLKIAIENESLVPDGLVNVESATLEDDLQKLQDLLEDDVPAYVLARLDGQEAKWLAITYVPDTASVRGKMLYASTRSAVTKSLGSAHFPDTLFATSKADLTVESYAAHKAHECSPKPLSAYEREIAEAGSVYEGSRARKNHVGTAVGLAWSDEAKHAVKALGEGQGNTLVLLSIDSASETLVFSSSAEKTLDNLASSLPASEPSYAFFAWSHKDTLTSSHRRDIVFIYSCPFSSPIKNRMLFSSGSNGVHLVAKSLFAESSSSYAARKIETSDPTELTKSYLVSELGLSESTPSGQEVGATAKVGNDTHAFARPKGPGRKR